MRKTVLIADDHPIFRRGLREVIDESGSYEVVGEAGDGIAAIELATKLRPAIAVVDISMPGVDGLEVLTQMATWHDAPRRIMLTMHDDYVDRAFDLGALGYLVKERASRELLRCLDVVSRGQRFLAEGLASERVVVTGPIDRLTPTEQRIVKLLADLRTSREVAALMKVSHRTVENHRYNICKKLGLSGPQGLLRFAAQHRSGF